ncbi:MmyB family transcriptional regulator [Nocardia asteroides]|uniref:MmyB family transcriptional regulator n=1 Tax=Nocardia asteroides TaxID=1824 RepID=UPI003427C0E8
MFLNPFLYPPPLLRGMPDFHDSLEFLRHNRELTRDAAAQEAGFSPSYLNQIIQQKKIPGPKVFDKIVRYFDLTSEQRQHLHELMQPSRHLPPVEELRRRLTSQGVHAHLAHLDRYQILGAYTDPLQTVLHGNETLYQSMPGLGEVDDNIMRWMITPAARERLTFQQEEASFLAANLRVALGRYRDDPRAQALFQTLRQHLEFHNAWDSTPMQVNYHWSRSAPIHVHPPGTYQSLALNLEVEEYGHCAELFIVHGLYDAPVIDH